LRQGGELLQVRPSLPVEAVQELTEPVRRLGATFHEFCKLLICKTQ